MTENERRVLEMLQGLEVGDAMTALDISVALLLTENEVERALGHLWDDGYVERVKGNRWEATA